MPSSIDSKVATIARDDFVKDMPETLTASDVDNNLIVFDIGCRFGIHPSWTRVKKAEFLRYYAFDVDKREIDRLNVKYQSYPNYVAINCGFSDLEETGELRVLRHHGQSTFFEPNTRSLWFGTHRVSDSTVEQTAEYRLITLDTYCSHHNVSPDFLKIDTEGSDFKIIKGATQVLKSVLAIRCEVHFQEVYKQAPLFDDIFGYLISNRFQLANLDYDGRGTPSSYFCPNPNKFGFISGVEAVFIRRHEEIELFSVAKKKKLILFCFLNNLEDLAHSILSTIDFKTRSNLSNDLIWIEIKREFCLSARKLLYAPGDSYLRAIDDYSRFFGENFPERHEFFESEFLNPP